MQQLQFVELDEAGRLVVSADDGTRYAVTVDDRLRSSLRPRPHAPTPERPGSTATPRDVQAMIRAGQTAEEVAQLTGWELERVRRFEGPVLAEREHVVGLAQRAPVRAQGRTDGTYTLDRRVRERLQGRGVELAEVSWDAARHAVQGPWTVLVIFSAGGRERRAAWHYDVPTRSVEALDDEARWLSEDEQALPGGLAGHPLLGTSHGEDEAAAELMATMRERRQRRGRRTARKEVGPDDPAHVPGQQAMPDEVLPLEDLHYDPGTMGPPPAAHPRGSAAESPAPVGAGPTDQGTDDDGVGDDSPAEESPADKGPDAATAKAQTSKGERAARRERRRMRMPRLPVVDPPAADQDDTEPDGTYARTRQDPNEVSFDEFFGTEEEQGEDVDEDDVILEDDLVLEDDVLVADEDPAEDEVPEIDAVQERQDEVPDAGPDPDEIDEADGNDDEPAEPAKSAGEAETQPSKTSARKGRTSVPSWDDIMFGSRDRG